jgi:hypothetical protein
MGDHPQNWYPPGDMAELEKACDLVSAHGAAVEVGCFTGQSTEMIAGKLGTVLAVDPWGKMDYADRPDLDAGYAYPRFVENTKHLPVVRFRCGWEAFFEVFDGPLAFIHIDAVHEYDHVRGNIIAALPYADRGTVFCGHDYVDHFPGVARAVSEIFPQHHVGGTGQRVWRWVCE